MSQSSKGTASAVPHNPLKMLAFAQEGKRAYLLETSLQQLAESKQPRVRCLEPTPLERRAKIEEREARSILNAFIYRILPVSRMGSGFYDENRATTMKTKDPAGIF